jgi:hypothetical protein
LRRRRRATDCAFEPQGDGHLTNVIDGRSFGVADGREIKFAGIEPVAADTTKADRTADLSAIIAGKDITLRGEDDAPDHYRRQSAFVFLAGSETPVQSLLLKEGAALYPAKSPKRPAQPPCWRPKPSLVKRKKALWLALPS